MSASARSSTGGEGSVASHDTDVLTDIRVYANDVRIPVGDVDLHIRKEGPLDVNRYIEGFFASPWNGQNYASLFRTTTPEAQERWDVLRVELKDYATDEYYTAFNGLVTGVGNTANGPSRRWKFRAKDPSFLLSKVPASKNFSDASPRDVVQYVTEELSEGLPLDITVGQTNDESFEEEDPSFDQLLTDPVGAFEDTAIQYSNTANKRSFQPNRDNLSDVLVWIQKLTDLHIWFTPTPNGLNVTATNTPTQQSHSMHNVGRDVALVENDAYVELKPVNTQVVKGGARSSTKELHGFEYRTPADEYTVAKAVHRGLLERAAGKELHANVETKTNALTASEVENQAKRLLKERIDETTGGTMTALLAPQITPFDTIEAKPVCSQYSERDADPVTYEVSRVHQKVRPDGFSTTTMNVGITASEDEIEVTRTWEKET